MKKIFEGLRPFQKAELLIMMLLAFAIPFSWLAAQYCEVALLVCAVLKVVFDQKFKFNENQMRFKWVYIIFALTWVMYLIGMIYTDNQAVGWAQVSKKLGFLIFPMIFLFSDVSYLTKDRVRVIFYCLVISVLTFFLMNFSWALYDVVFKDFGTYRLFNEDLMKVLYVHHSYMSMYATLAMVFCFVEILEHDKLRIKVLNTIAVVLLMLFVFLLNSRAGLLCMILIIIVLLIWVTFVKKKRKVGIISSVAIVFIFVVTYMIVPDVFTRWTYTIKNIISEESTDRRFVQLKASKAIVSENWMFGVGSGDRSDAVLAAYINYRDELVDRIKPVEGAEKTDFEEGRKKMLEEVFSLSQIETWNEPNEQMFKFINENSAYYKCDAESVKKVAVEYIYVENAIYHELNSHNQFITTIVSVGIIGLVLLLAYFIIPLVFWIINKKFDVVYFTFLLTVGLNAMFESLFETQKGIIFFCFFNSLLFTLSIRPKLLGGVEK